MSGNAVEYILTGLVAIAVAVYLVVALLRPEQF
jgi:K+-transporting ATPase KdpF subunit